MHEYFAVFNNNWQQKIQNCLLVAMLISLCDLA